MKKKFEHLDSNVFQKITAIDNVRGGTNTVALTRYNTCCEPHEGGTLCGDQKCDDEEGGGANW